MDVLPARDAYDRWALTYPPVAHNSLMSAEEAEVVQPTAIVKPTSARAANPVFMGGPFAWSLVIHHLTRTSQLGRMRVVATIAAI